MLPVSLEKRQENVGIVLKKRQIENIKSRVCLVSDVSGSTISLFNNGDMQEAISRIYAIASKFDDDGKLDSIVFNTSSKVMPEVTAYNYSEYAETIRPKESLGTKYAPAIDNVVAKYFGGWGKGLLSRAMSFIKKDSVNDTPIFVAFLTDGECDDADRAEELIERYKDKNIYWMFVGVGKGHFQTIKYFASTFPNAGFTQIKSISEMSDVQMYEALLNPEYVNWVKGK